VSIQNIQPNYQGVAAFYLANLSQSSTPSSLSQFNPNKPFTPPISAVWVNELWFLSLVISLTCALLATLVQQWARRYERVAYPSYSPYKQARIRAFYRQGVEKLRIRWAIEVLPTLLHVSLFLFFAGLSVFLFGVHLTIFKSVTAWIGICVLVYACLTFLPIIYKDSPYCAPLSASFSFCLTGSRYIFFRLFQRFPHIDPRQFMPVFRTDSRTVHLDDFFSHSMTTTAEQYAFKLPPDIDYHSLLWTFESIDEDGGLEKFFEAFPRLCDSETGKELKLQQSFIKPNEKKLSSALIGLMNRTLTSNLVTEFVKQRRMIICTKAVESTSLLGPWWILRCVLLGDWSRFLECIEFGLFVQKWKNITHKVTIFYAQCVAALTISIVRDRDERWFRLASGLLDASKTLLHKYIKTGDSILLATAMFIVRRTIQTYSGSEERHRKEVLSASSRTLEKVCKLDVGSTLPELQHEFCGLWNKIVDAAQTDPLPHHSSVCLATLKNVRKLYLALHDSADTPFYTTTDDRDPILDNPKSYPMCTIDDHRPSPVADLEFDEPAPDSASAPPTPIVGPSMPTSTFSYPPGLPPTSIPPSHSSSPPALCPTSAASSQYSPPLLNPHSHLAAPHHPGAPIPFPVPQVTYSQAPNVPRGGNVHLPPPPLPPRHRPASSVPSIYLDNASTSSSDSSGGHVP
jgi:hypothetical protein